MTAQRDGAAKEKLLTSSSAAMPRQSAATTTARDAAPAPRPPVDLSPLETLLPVAGALNSARRWANSARQRAKEHQILLYAILLLSLLALALWSRYR